MKTVIPNHLKELECDTNTQISAPQNCIFAQLADTLLAKSQFLTAKQVGAYIHIGKLDLWLTKMVYNALK